MTVSRKPVYLDYNATTPHAPEVIEAMRPFLESEFGNPSSSHCYGKRPRRAVSRAREQVAQLIGCTPDEIVFTSGGTEANNQALKAVAGGLDSNRKHIITSQIEHPAVLEVCRYLEKQGFAVTYVPVGEDGIVNVSDVMSAITSSTVMISIMHANNEVGTLQPISEIAERVRNKDILVHTDTAQSLGKIPVKVDELGIDLLTIAGHKIYGPKGVGALFVRNGVPQSVFCHGAGQEMGWRGGTENVMAIVGLGQSCELAFHRLKIDGPHLQTMRNRLENGLLAKIGRVRFNGHREKRLPNTASVSFHGIDATEVLNAISSEVAASAGAACHSAHVEISHVLEAMAVPREWARGTIRFSTGRTTAEQDIDRAVEAVTTAVKQLRP